MKYYLGKMKLLLVAVAIIFAGLVFTWSRIFGNLQNQGQNNNSGNLTTGSITPNQKFEVGLSVDFGNGKVTNYGNIEINEGGTAYSVLVKKMSETDTKVTTKAYDIGIMVESINGYAASSESFWVFSVNGKNSDVAADKYILKQGDSVVWKYSYL
jgi:hypothetical protein